MPTWSQDDGKCYELVDEVGREGYSCLVYTAGPRGGPFPELTFCQLRRAGGVVGVCVVGAGAPATRVAVCRAYLKLRLGLP